MIGDIEDDGGDEGGGDEEPVTKEDVTITFAKDVDTAAVGGEYSGQVATTSPAGKTLTYTSSDTNVATVNESTGAVTVVAAGTTLIKAVFAGDDTHNAAQASYALTVTSE